MFWRAYVDLSLHTLELFKVRIGLDTTFCSTVELVAGALSARAGGGALRLGAARARLGRARHARDRRGRRRLGLRRQRRREWRRWQSQKARNSLTVHKVRDEGFWDDADTFRERLWCHLQAAELTRCGLRVLVLEKGANEAADSFDGEEKEALKRMYERGGLLASDDGSVGILAGASVQRLRIPLAFETRVLRLVSFLWPFFESVVESHRTPVLHC